MLYLIAAAACLIAAVAGPPPYGAVCVMLGPLDRLSGYWLGACLYCWWEWVFLAAGLSLAAVGCRALEQRRGRRPHDPA